MRRRTFFGGLTVLACAVALPADARTLQQVLNGGTIRIGIAMATPWAMYDREDEFIGYDIDIGKKLAEDMSLEPVFVLYEWDRLIPALELGEIDIVAAGLTVTPERALHVNFSAPYSTGGVTLATNLSSTAEVKSLADLNSPDYTLGVLTGSVSKNLAQRILPRIELQEFDSTAAAGTALVDGEIDAYLEEEPVPTFLSLDNPTKIDVPLSNLLLTTHAAFAVGKGDPDFLAFLNAWIIAREDDTWLPTTYNYWFKSLQWRGRLGVIPDF